jgi:hypothetical protein
VRVLAVAMEGVAGRHYGRKGRNTREEIRREEKRGAARHLFPNTKNNLSIFYKYSYDCTCNEKYFFLFFYIFFVRVVGLKRQRGSSDRGAQAAAGEVFLDEPMM